MFPREEPIGLLENCAQLLEDEGIQRVGSDVALGAAPMLSASADRIMIGAIVIAVIGAVASAHTMTADRDATVAALEHVAQ